MSNLKVVQASFKAPSLPNDFAAMLRKIADDVDAGRVTAAAMAFIHDGTYMIVMPSSIEETLTLATLLHKRSVDAFTS